MRNPILPPSSFHLPACRSFLPVFSLLVSAFSLVSHGAIHQVRTGDDLQAKITAAVTGDTVYIKEGVHAGDIIIDGKAIRLMAEDRTNHTLTGSVTIQNVPQGKKVILKNLNISEGLTCTGTSLNLIRCVVELDVTCPDTNDAGGNPLNLVVYQSEIKEKLIAKTAKSWIGYSTIRHMEVTGVTHIVGNQIHGRNSLSIGVHIHGAGSQLSMYNNWIYEQGGSTGVNIQEKAIGVLVDIGGKADIINNRIFSGDERNDSGEEVFCCIGVYVKSSDVVNIISNVIIGGYVGINKQAQGDKYGVGIYAQRENVNIFYNLVGSSGQGRSFGGGCVHFGTLSGPTKFISNSWLTTGFSKNKEHAGINKGPPDPLYNNHDGTRNNIGASGGRNYIQQGHLEDKPIPLWIDADPIRVPKGGKITLKSLGVVGK